MKLPSSRTRTPASGPSVVDMVIGFVIRRRPNARAERGAADTAARRRISWWTSRPAREKCVQNRPRSNTTECRSLGALSVVFSDHLGAETGCESTARCTHGGEGNRRGWTRAHMTRLSGDRPGAHAGPSISALAGRSRRRRNSHQGLNQCSGDCRRRSTAVTSCAIGSALLERRSATRSRTHVVPVGLDGFGGAKQLLGEIRRQRGHKRTPPRQSGSWWLWRSAAGPREVGSTPPFAARGDRDVGVYIMARFRLAWGGSGFNFNDPRTPTSMGRQSPRVVPATSGHNSSISQIVCDPVPAALPAVGDGCGSYASTHIEVGVTCCNSSSAGSSA